MMTIGEAAQASGVSAKMIRYYEGIGLIGPATRSEANYRVYSSGDIHTLKFIRRARSLGFSVEEMSRLLELWRNRARNSADVKRLAIRHVEELEAKIAEMRQMAETLRHLAQHCSGDSRPECPILDDLATASASAAPRTGRRLAASRVAPGQRDRASI